MSTIDTASTAWHRQIARLAEAGEWARLAKAIDTTPGTLAAPGALAAHLDELGIPVEPAWLDRVRAWGSTTERFDEGGYLQIERGAPKGIDWTEAGARIRSRAQDLIADGDTLAASKLLGLPSSAAAHPRRFAQALDEAGIELDPGPSLWQQIKAATTTTIRASDLEAEDDEAEREALR